MNTLSIGDTHGNFVLDDVKRVMDKHDKIIFVGDYVDSFTLDNPTINKNLCDLIEFKKENEDKVVLLLGNHDLQYMYNNDIHRCSGYRPEIRFDLFDIFNNNKDVFQIAFQIDNYLWTHAGINTGWYKYRFNKFIKKNNLKDMLIVDQLNFAFESYEETLFDVGHWRGGYLDVGGPFWADKRELINNPLKGYHQIVGHTRVKDYTTNYKNNDTSVTFIDVIESHIENFEFLRENSFYSSRI